MAGCTCNLVGPDIMRCLEDRVRKTLAHPVHILDVDGLRICVELQDELLQVEEGPLVPDVLPYLQD